MPQARVEDTWHRGNQPQHTVWKECVSRRMGAREKWGLVCTASLLLLSHPETFPKSVTFTMSSLFNPLIFMKSSGDYVSRGFLFCTWLQCHRQTASHARIRGLGKKPSWIILLMLNNLHHYINYPLTVFIKCYVCLAMSLHYLNIRSGGSFNLPSLAWRNFCFSSGSIENNHMCFTEKPRIWHSHSGNLRECAADW